MSDSKGLRLSEAFLRTIQDLSESNPKLAATSPWWDKPEEAPFSKVADDLIAWVHEISGRRPTPVEDETHDLPEMFHQHTPLMRPENIQSEPGVDVFQDYKPYLHSEATSTSEFLHHGAHEIYDLLGDLTLGLISAGKLPPEQALDKLEFWCREIRKVIESQDSEDKS